MVKIGPPVYTVTGASEPASKACGAARTAVAAAAPFKNSRRFIVTSLWWGVTRGGRATSKTFFMYILEYLSFYNPLQNMTSTKNTKK